MWTLDLIGRALLVLGAALVCSGAFFMLRSRAPGTQVEDDEGVTNEPRMPTGHDATVLDEKQRQAKG